jgi:5-enolpyruvylshikimate-3-phosphate synthase
MQQPTQNHWRIEGFDTFSSEEYPIPGDYSSEADAIAAAKAYLDELESTQPTSSSGGQNGIQDRVFVVSPDGSKFRIFPG